MAVFAQTSYNSKWISPKNTCTRDVDSIRARAQRRMEVAENV